MPTMYKNVEHTQNALSDLFKPQIEPDVWLREADIAPITSILQALSTKTATSFKYQWAEDTLNPHVDTTAASATAVDTTLTVTNASYWNVDDYVKVVATGEVAGPVTSINETAGTITVGARGAGETAAAAIPNGAVLVILRGNIKEGGNAAEAINTIPVMQYNYVERWSHSVKVTDTIDNIQFWTGSERQRLLRKKWIEHREAIELKIMFGERGVDTSSANGPRYLMRGIERFIQTNIYTVTASPQSFTQAQWNDFLKQVFAYGGTEKTIFCSGEVMQQIASFGIANMQTRPGDTKLGLAVTSYVCPFGTVRLIHHRFLNATYQRAWYAYALDLSKIDFVPLTRTKLNTNIQPEYAHYVWDEYFTEATLAVRNETSHGIFRVLAS